MARDACKELDPDGRTQKSDRASRSGNDVTNEVEDEEKGSKEIGRLKFHVRTCSIVLRQALLSIAALPAYQHVARADNLPR
jgi:hypothetical protein